MSCASPLATPAPPDASPVVAVGSPTPFVDHFAARRRKEPHEDLVGLVSLAFVLLAVSAVFALNTSLFVELGTWGQEMSAHRTVFVRPPEGVIVSAAWFFAVMGIFEFFAALLRGALRWTRPRVLGRVLSGIGDLVFAGLLFLYSARSIAGAFLIAILAGTLGVLLIVYVSLGIYWASWGSSPRAEPIPPSHQP